MLPKECVYIQRVLGETPRPPRPRLRRVPHSQFVFKIIYVAKWGNKLYGKCVKGGWQHHYRECWGRPPDQTPLGHACGASLPHSHLQISCMVSAWKEGDNITTKSAGGDPQTPLWHACGASLPHSHLQICHSCKCEWKGGWQHHYKECHSCKCEWKEGDNITTKSPGGDPQTPRRHACGASLTYTLVFI
jgi:hypothetical protein